MKRLGRALQWWFGTVGLVIAAIVFGVLGIANQLSFPDKFWTQNASWAVPLLFIAGAYTTIVGPISVFVTNAQLRGLRDTALMRETCQQILLRVQEACPDFDVQSLAVHVWKASGDKLDRVTGFRVELRQDAGVTWTKGKGVVGRCWADNLDVESDLSGLQAAADLGRNIFERITVDRRLGLTWDDFRKTRRYWSIYATPLKDSQGDFIGCVSVDCTQAGHFKELIAACRHPGVGGLLFTIESKMRGT